jgi:hypothetical protein
MRGTRHGRTLATLRLCLASGSTPETESYSPFARVQVRQMYFRPLDLTANAAAGNLLVSSPLMLPADTANAVVEYVEAPVQPEFDPSADSSGYRLRKSRGSKASFVERLRCRCRIGCRLLRVHLQRLRLSDNGLTGVGHLTS